MHATYLSALVVISLVAPSDAGAGCFSANQKYEALPAVPNVIAQTAEDCQTQCQYEALPCHFFSFSAVKHGLNCWFLAGTSTLTEGSGFISGPAKCPDTPQAAASATATPATSAGATTTKATTTLANNTDGVPLWGIVLATVGVMTVGVLVYFFACSGGVDKTKAKKKRSERSQKTGNGKNTIEPSQDRSGVGGITDEQRHQQAMAQMAVVQEDAMTGGPDQWPLLARPASNGLPDRPPSVPNLAPSVAQDLWDIDLAYSLGPAIGKPDNGAIQRFDASQISSITQGVEMLNNGALTCAAGICIIYSSNHREYFLLARADKKRDAIQIARDTFHVDVQEVFAPVALAAPAPPVGYMTQPLKPMPMATYAGPANAVRSPVAAPAPQVQQSFNPSQQFAGVQYMSLSTGPIEPSQPTRYLARGDDQTF